MAELEQKAIQNPFKKASPHQKKMSVNVDLTPMVDLGFLLITFFIVTTSLTRPRVMKIFLPTKGKPIFVSETGSLTLIPLSGNSVFYYEGLLSKALQSHRMGVVDFSLQTGIGNIIRAKQEMLDKNAQFQEGRKGLFVMIKPYSATNYQNIIRSLDEMSINDVKKYSLVDINEEELKLLKSMNIN